jgi:hypothetical protein
MADASRFPELALPFAVVGAAAGWLSAGFVDSPLLGFEASRPAAAACAAAMGGLLGLVLRQLCVGGRYRYELGEPSPEVRPRLDHWLVHSVLVLAAGAATGALTRTVSRDRESMVEWMLGATACAGVFVPVCLAVLSAGRRAQRARLGSLVATGDRRAVWGILAVLLAGTTVLALPEWPAWGAGEGSAPLAVPVVLVAAVAATLAIRAKDRRVAARAQAVLDADLSEGTAGDEVNGAPPAMDMGLGDETLGQVVRGAAAYRQRERIAALVKGSPEKAVATLERAAFRGSVALTAIGIVSAFHVAAGTQPAMLLYQDARCGAANPEACDAAVRLVHRDPRRVAALRRRARRGTTE